MACISPLDDEPTTATFASDLTAAVAPSLGTAASFAVLGAATVTCTNASTITGDVGVSPGTAITGFNPDCSTTGAIQAGSAVAAQAHGDMATAYDGLAAAACDHDLTGQDLGGQTLAPGVYCVASSVGLTGALTLDGGGNRDAVWVFQIGSTITTATGSSVVMAGSGQPCNVFWQVGSSATIGTGTAFQGNLLAEASITLTSGSSLVGRALARSAAVTMDHNAVSVGACAGSAPPSCPAEERLSGSGQIKVDTRKARFTVHAGIKRGAVFGHLTYNDASANTKVISQHVTAYQALGAATRRILGTATINGRSGFTYQVDVTDRNGSADTFAIVLSNGYHASGAVHDGYIRRHVRPGHPGACDDDDDDDDDGDDDGDGDGDGGHCGHDRHY